MAKYLEPKSYSEGTEKTFEQGNLNPWNSVRTYDLTRKSNHSITGLYHRDDNEDTAFQYVYFRVEDLKWFPSFADRMKECNSERKVLLQLAEDISGWYGYDTGSGHDCSGKWFAQEPVAQFVGKSKKWICVSQYAAIDI